MVDSSEDPQIQESDITNSSRFQSIKNLFGNRKIASWLPAILLAIALPLTVIATMSQQTLRNFAAISTGSTLNTVEVNPGQITIKVGEKSIGLSALGYDSAQSPIYTGVTYEWGMSSVSGIGTLTRVTGDITEFVPKKIGWGEIYVIATQGTISVNKTIQVIVTDNDGNIPPQPTPTPTITPTPTPKPIFTAIRFSENPLIVPSMLSGTAGSNINGPSLIKVPTWLPNKLGNYYFYFANHSGTYIRLAYSNNLHGPWTVYSPGTLKLSQATACKGHIASPDVHVDNVKKVIRMYFHCPARGGTAQYTFVATSTNGKKFTAQTKKLGFPYFRVFEYGGYYYAIGKNESSSSPKSFLYRSKNPYSGFTKGKSILPNSRHTAVYLNGNTAYIFYSRIGDAPERILLSTMDISANWTTWTPSAPTEVLKPENSYEGVSLPISPSKYGEVNKPVNQLRDPGIYQEADKLYLLYSIAGEQGIAAAELIMQ